MESPDLSRAHRVEAGAQAAALDHPLRWRLLLACARRERSLTELARQLGQPLKKLHYHLAPLVDSGLLQVSRIEPRRGRPIRHYRAIAEAFVVSLADIGEPVGETLAREQRRSLAEEANRRELSLHYHLGPEGGVRVLLVDPEGSSRPSRAFDHWKNLRLTAEQRKALAEDLTAVIARYEAASGGAGAEPFLVHAAFAPKL
jgi:DNA-binding MarR family transcriptional regulator